MQTGKFNCVIDGFWGSSGKGKVSTWLADHFNVSNVSSANLPNAGHSAVFEGGYKYVAKAIPTSACLRQAFGRNINCWISPGSGFSWDRLLKEWVESGKPVINIHERVSIVTADHAKRERDGAESTAHIASTMQGSATALVDKILRRADCQLARNTYVTFMKEMGDKLPPEFIHSIRVIGSEVFRDSVQTLIENSATWLHEGSQGYALSIDHGSHYPNCTSRNCSVQAAMDYMSIPPKMVGDVYLNLRSFPIRVGNLIDPNSGQQLGYSGDFYEDCRELTWGQVALDSGMPREEADKLAESERTTVTKRIRRVCTFSDTGLKDAVRTNGATKLSMNFIQYINWNDAHLNGGPEAFCKLSKKSRAFIEHVENVANVPVVLIGTGALHHEMISLL
jgi:adenylosuccinate synthase